MAITLDTFHSPMNIVVVGASGGIGRALVEHCVGLHQVSHVYGLSRTHHSINTEHSAASYQSLTINYEDESSIERAAGLIDQPVDLVLIATGFLHNSEGVKPEKTYQQLSTDGMMQNMLLNTIGPSLVVKHFLPQMRADSKTLIGALSARVGSIGDNRLGGWYSYRSSKAALNMMLKTFAVESARRHPNTIITGLHPGTVDTTLSKPFQRNVKPEKLFAPEYSAQCLLTVANQLTIDDSGHCFAWDGQIIIP